MSVSRLLPGGQSSRRRRSPVQKRPLTFPQLRLAIRLALLESQTACIASSRRPRRSRRRSIGRRSCPRSSCPTAAAAAAAAREAVLSLGSLRRWERLPVLGPRPTQPTAAREPPVLHDHLLANDLSSPHLLDTLLHLCPRLDCRPDRVEQRRVFGQRTATLERVQVGEQEAEKRGRRVAELRGEGVGTGEDDRGFERWLICREGREQSEGLDG